jgi:hypothetical protein
MTIIGSDLIELTEGFGVDEGEAWHKLVSRQFAGRPGRGFAELVSNYLDSYPASTPWSDRRAAIETGPGTIAITDWGEGMEGDRLRLLLTLGGSDKRGDSEKIGRFGIGFFAIFDPALGTRRVTVTTRWRGRGVCLRLEVLDPTRPPAVTADLLPERPPFSTRIEVVMDRDGAVSACLRHARERLRWCPSPVTFDGVEHTSEWDAARQHGAVLFERANCHGFLSATSGGLDVTCKYQPVGLFSVTGVATERPDRKNDLRDNRAARLPHLPRLSGAVNCDDLHLTIARDSFYMDAAYRRLVGALRAAVFEWLRRTLKDTHLDAEERSQLVLANHFVLSAQIAEWLGRREQAGEATDEDDVYAELASAPVYPIDGRREPMSLLDLVREKSADLPLFFAPEQSNLRWLGGDFRHDFVVLPPDCAYRGGAPLFYETVFSDVFRDAVNLDTVPSDDEKLQELLQRGVIKTEALRPKARVLGELEVKPKEKALLDEMNDLLAGKAVRAAVEHNLALRARRITAAYFRLENDAALISTGLFDSTGSPVAHTPMLPIPQDLVLALRIDHPVVACLARSADPYRAQYALTLLSHELARSQPVLAPDTRVFHLVKDGLAAELRRGMVKQLLEVR